MATKKKSTISLSPVNTDTDSPVSRLLPHDTTVDNNFAGDGGDAVADGIEEGLGEREVVVTVMKRKRGRPRKHPVVENITLTTQPQFFASPSQVPIKRGRGRPRGSTSKSKLLPSLGGFATDKAAGNFTAHVVTVFPGENIGAKILSFLHRGPRSTCILSATGAVSSVMIHQSGSSCRTPRYEGLFEILTLSGSFTFGEMGGTRRKTGALRVLLATPDGRVFGGRVAGSLMAAGPVQLVVGSFKQNIGKEPKRKYSAKTSMAAAMPGNTDMVTVLIPITSMTDGDENCMTLTPITKMTDGDENCVTPTSALPEPIHGGAGNQNVNPSSLCSGWYASQPSQSSDIINVGVPET